MVVEVGFAVLVVGVVVGQVHGGGGVLLWWWGWVIDGGGG